MNHRVVAAIFAVILIVITAIVTINDWTHWWADADLQAFWKTHPAWEYGFASVVVIALGYCMWVLTASIDGRLPVSKRSRHLRAVK